MYVLISAKVLFKLLANSIGLGLVIIKLVSSANSTSLAFLAVTEGRSFMYNNKQTRRYIHIVVNIHAVSLL
jgi:hypothetical protein